MVKKLSRVKTPAKPRKPHVCPPVPTPEELASEAAKHHGAGFDDGVRVCLNMIASRRNDLAKRNWLRQLLDQREEEAIEIERRIKLLGGK